MPPTTEALQRKNCAVLQIHLPIQEGKGGTEGIVANIWNILALTVLHAAALNLH